MKNRSSWPSWAFTAMALLGLMGLAEAQEAPLTAWTGERWMPRTSADASITAPAEHAVPTAITDDHHAGDELLEARQLIIALTAAEPRIVPVEVFDERGRSVRSCALRATPGRRALVLDVSALAHGRYVARIGEAGPLVRFIR